MSRSRAPVRQRAAKRSRPKPIAAARSPLASFGAFEPVRSGWTPLLVFGAALLLHVRTLGFGFTHLDDTELIVDDLPFLREPANLWSTFGRAYFAHGVDAYYRPLVTASYALDAQWSAARPFGYHLTNLLLHGAASVLAFFLLRRLKFADPAATLAAVLFAVHPALVESVAWIPGRNDLLLAVFAPGGWVLLIDAIRRPKWSLKAGHAACFLAALFTKETAIVLPVVFATHVSFRADCTLPDGTVVPWETDGGAE